MEDRCLMQVTCAAADETAFRELGFRPVERRGSAVIVEDPAARRAHDDDLPWHALYHGSHVPGAHHDGAKFVCNGRAFASVAVGREGGIVVHLEADGSTCPSDLEEWLRFVALQKEVLTSLAELESQSEPTPLLPTLPDLESLSVLAARDDPWMMEMLQQSALEWITSIQGSLSRELTDQEKAQLISAYKVGHFQTNLPAEAAPVVEPGALHYEI